MNRTNRDEGLSDALGAILLVAIVGMAVAVISAVILSEPVPQKIPALTADITTVGRTILITHNGGDPLQKSEMGIIVDGVDLKDSFQRIDGSGWSGWAAGDSLLYRVPDGQPMPQGVTIYSLAGSSAQSITSMGVPQSVSAGGIYTTETATPAITTTTTTPPVPPLPVIATFAGTPTSGNKPLAVQFTDASTGPVTSWSWMFGDGNTSSVQSPLFTYEIAGTYTVSLTVSNGTGSDTQTRTNYITVTTSAPAPVTASFTGSPTSGNKPLAVQFTDASTGPVTSWSWTFGDGGTSIASSPLYTYPNAGTYSVSLTVSNGTGSNTLTRTNYITASLPPRQTLFSDNFETAFSGWTTSGTAIWNAANPRNGTYAIQFSDNGQISRTVSTGGYETIIVSFALAANSLEGTENVYAQWSPDGSTWNTMAQIVNGDAFENNALHYYSVSLPVGADNDASFAIRFGLVGTGNDRGYVDDIAVTGNPL